MSKMFGNLSKDNAEGVEEVRDVIGGGGVLETNVYDCTVKLAYVGKSQSSDAQNITVILDHEGREIRETIYITNRNGENTYQDKKDETKRHFLPGFVLIDDLCLFTTENELAEQNIEEKTVEIYDFDARKEVPTNVPVLVDLIGKPVSAAVFHDITNKQKKVGNDYVDTNEKREFNSIEKFLHPETKKTISEYKNGVEEATYYPKWVEKYAGKPRDRFKDVAEGRSGAPGGRATKPTQGGAAGAERPKKALFGK